MATLANVTKETRLILKFGGIALALLIFGFLVFKVGAFLINIVYPPPPPAPEEKFGKLLPIIFPQQAGALPQFRINTVSGTLPAFSSIINVYKALQQQPSITSLQTAKRRAGNLAYTQNQHAITTEEYTWTMATENNTLRYNIVSLNFSVSSDYLVNPSPGRITSDKSVLLKTVGDFINTLGSNHSDIDFNKSVISFYMVQDGNLIETPDPTNASVARVYLIQNPVETLPMYYPTQDPSLLYFTLSGANATVVDASYNHLTPDPTSFSTYPLRTADAAFQDLSSGKGFIVNATADSTVDITDVTLGYYAGDQGNQMYLIPIIVFHGKNNFKAYVNAIAD